MIRVLCRIASLRLTLVGLCLLAVGLVIDQKQWFSGVWAVTLPLVLLAMNLAAALLVDRRFRHRPALFAFHLCLLLLLQIAGYGQLVRYESRLLLVEGQAYANALVERVRIGPLAPPALVEGFMTQGEVAVDYTSGLRRGATRSRVWVADRGWREVGDDVPLLLDGYRFYTTSNKGFAALLVWLPRSGAPQLGAVQFPSYPARELMQSASWQTPAGETLDMTLLAPPSPYGGVWTLNRLFAQDAEIELTVDGRREVLRPGDEVTLFGGRLRYERISMWMGYRIYYDPTLPWLFSVAVLAVVFMTVHFAGRILRPANISAASGREYLA